MTIQAFLKLGHFPHTESLIKACETQKEHYTMYIINHSQGSVYVLVHIQAITNGQWDTFKWRINDKFRKAIMKKIFSCKGVKYGSSLKFRKASISFRNIFLLLKQFSNVQQLTRKCIFKIRESRSCFEHDLQISSCCFNLLTFKEKNVIEKKCIRLCLVSINFFFKENASHLDEGGVPYILISITQRAASDDYSVWVLIVNWVQLPTHFTWHSFDLMAQFYLVNYQAKKKTPYLLESYIRWIHSRHTCQNLQ